MTGYQIISDIQRLTTLEARSARPDAAIQGEPDAKARYSMVEATRFQMTVLLRRVADLLEPAPTASADATPCMRSQGC